jgi:hypothetical protein
MPFDFFNHPNPGISGALANEAFILEEVGV